jgi:hypothetical protein
MAQTDERQPRQLALERPVLTLRRPPAPRLPAAPQAAETQETPHRRAVFAGPLVAFITMASALLCTNAAGIPLRDPDHVAGRRLLLVLWVVGALIALDVIVRAARHDGRIVPRPRTMLVVWRERWTLRRGLAVLTALVSFYITYLAYRNLKSVVPLLRPGDLFDAQLASLDRSMFAGQDPAVLLHDLLGTAVAAQVMSTVYMLFFAFIPGTLAFALVFSPNLQAGLFYATAQSINWVLGAASYFMLPSLGPVYADPEAFSRLPNSGASQLQAILLDQRLEFLRDPLAGSAQSIAAFSSLHVSIFFTGALAAHVLGLPRNVRIVAWSLLGVTVTSTIYLGWHYAVDDLGGVVIGVVAVALARLLTGLKPRAARA